MLSILVAEQNLHRLDVTAMGGRISAVPPITVLAVQIGVGLERELEDLGAPLRGSIEKRRVLDEVLGVHVGAFADQKARDLDMIAMGCGEERGAAAVSRALMRAPLARSWRTMTSSPRSAAVISA